jgi:hypothetical protein
VKWQRIKVLWRTGRRKTDYSEILKGISNGGREEGKRRVGRLGNIEHFDLYA